MTEYRIDYTITRREPGDADFTEIGFGSSDAWSTVNQATETMAAYIQNRLWETTEGMPDPDSLENQP